jgi:hypothetical protein
MVYNSKIMCLRVKDIIFKAIIFNKNIFKYL